MKGNCSLMITLQGGIYQVNKTIKTILIQLCKYYLVDLKAIRSYYGNLLNIKNLTPIPFNKENIFIPVKVRKPLLKNDGSIGYVNIKYIRKVSLHNEKTIIYLTDNNTIECLNSVETINKHINNGNIVRKLYEEKERASLVNERYIDLDYDRPATKGDVVMIINELLRIKESIKL